MSIRCQNVHRFPVKKDIKTIFNFRYEVQKKEIRTGITDKQGFRYTCYVATYLIIVKGIRVKRNLYDHHRHDFNIRSRNMSILTIIIFEGNKFT